MMKLNSLEAAQQMLTTAVSLESVGNLAALSPRGPWGTVWGL